MGQYSPAAVAEVASLPASLAGKKMCRYYDGKQVVESYGFDADASTFGLNCLFLLGESLLLRIFAYVLLLRTTRIGPGAGK
eukprot:g12177.t1